MRNMSAAAAQPNPTAISKHITPMIIPETP